MTTEERLEKLERELAELRSHLHEPLLLNATQAMRLFNVRPSTWYGDKSRGYVALVNRLKAQGLRSVQIRSSKPGGKPSTRFLTSSVRKLIEHAVNHETPLG